MRQYYYVNEFKMPQMVFQKYHNRSRNENEKNISTENIVSKKSNEPIEAAAMLNHNFLIKNSFASFIVRRPFDVNVCVCKCLCHANITSSTASQFTMMPVCTLHPAIISSISNIPCSRLCYSFNII